MANERMTEAEHMAMFQILQREMAAICQKNEEEIRISREQNKEMRQQLVEFIPRPKPKKPKPKPKRPLSSKESEDTQNQGKTSILRVDPY